VFRDDAALKFTPEGGCVFVSTSRKNGSLAITVSDTGISIAPADSAKAMQTFG
jgi:signal transduction histidine kinase